MRFILLLLCLQSTALCAAPRVVTSIAPLQEITAAIMMDIAAPELIIDNRASIHHFAFKPSHMRRLQQADLVIWIDRNFEAGFNRVPESLPATTRRLELLPALGIDPGQGHIWFSPTLLMQAVETISGTLQEMDPDNRDAYRENSDRMLAAISAWQVKVRNQLQAMQPRYATDHAFLEHFERDMGVTAVAMIQDRHDDHGSLRDLRRVEKLLQQNPAACLLTAEPPVNSLAHSLAQKYQLKIIDISAMPTIDQGQARFLQRLEGLIRGLNACR